MKRLVTQIFKLLSWYLLIAISGGLLIAGGTYLYLSPSLPSVEALRDIQLQTPLRVYSNDGKLMAEYGEKKRIPVKFDEIPPLMVKAFLAAEDDRFYSHHGVDPIGLLRATVQLLSTGRIQSGGSTITMQVAKNFFLSRERVFSRKFNEILLALEIEQKLSKKNILELYLNKIYLGNRAYGIGAAAQVYYGKDVSELTLAEIAMIAGLPKAPSRYNPIVNPNRSLLRRNWILSRMIDLGYINQEEYQQAYAQPSTASFHNQATELNAPYAAEMARQEAFERFGEDIYTEGYTIATTIDSTMQEAANESLNKGLHTYDERHGYRGIIKNLGSDETQWEASLHSESSVGNLVPAVVTSVDKNSVNILLKDQVTATINWDGLSWAKPYINVNALGQSPQEAKDILALGDLIWVRYKNDAWRLAQIPEVQGALISMIPKNGAILSIVGGFNFYDSNYNRATQANRQVGSALKPFVYSAAIANGMTASTIINDAPLIFNDDILQTQWRPQNDNERFYGLMRLREGLYRSRNLVSIRVLQRTGINTTIDYMSKLGIPEEKLPKDLSLALGSAALTPLDLASSYSIIANGGFQIKPYLVAKIVNSNTEETIYEATPPTACISCAPQKTDIENLPEITLSTLKNKDPESSSQTDDSITSVLAERVMDQRVNYIIRDILEDVITKGTGRRATILKRSDIGGKTGTTNEQKDLWFSGFNPDIQTTVWVGFDQPKTLGRWEYGANVALPIWIDFMKIALKGKPERHLPQPPGIVTVRINTKTGRLARPNDTDSAFEIFRSENVPKASSMDDNQPLDDQFHSDILF